MEKYGCNRIEDINARIRELEAQKYKTASTHEELDDLRAHKKDLEREIHEDARWDAPKNQDYFGLSTDD